MFETFIVKFSDNNINNKYTSIKILNGCNISYDIIKRTDEDNGPYGTSWIHEEQKDDIITDIERIRSEKFKKLREIVLPPQRSEEWFAMRNGKITASDGGCVLGKNKHEPMFKFVLKKIEPAFQNNKFCYHLKYLSNHFFLILSRNHLHLKQYP